MSVVSRALARSALLLLVLVVPCQTARPMDSGGRLFVVERNLNANAVAYDVVTTGAGRLDPGSPLRVYWVMWAERGQMRELSALERSLAYGYDVRSCGTNACTVSLRALRSRPIVVEIAGGAARAVTSIGAGRAVLRRVFVTVAGGGVFPSVESVELFGESCSDASPLYERIAGR
jgi:hypothetical protein